MNPGQLVRFFILLLCAFFFSSAQAGNYSFLSFNLESGGANIYVVANQLEPLSREKPADIWLFSNIRPDWSDELANAVAISSGSEVDFIPEDGGRNNKYLVVFNKERFDIVQVSQPDLGTFSNRNPITLVKFRDRSSGKQFITLLNFSSRRDYLGAYLGKDLNAWAKGLQEPVIAFGHFDFGWPIAQGEKSMDENFTEMVAGNIFQRVRPTELMATDCDKQGQVVDVVLTSGMARH